MNKTVLLISTLFLLLVICSSTVHALHPPWVRTHGGEISLVVVGDKGIVLGLDYGLTSAIAISGRVGGPFSRIGIKVEARPALAVIGGVARNQKFYLGFNTARSLNEDFLGILEASLVTDGRDFALEYQLGVRYSINPGLDIRGGIISKDLDFPNIQLGVGYMF